MRQGLQVWSLEPSQGLPAKSRGKRAGNRRGTPNSGHTSNPGLIYLLNTHKESHLSKGLSLANRR